MNTTTNKKLTQNVARDCGKALLLPLGNIYHMRIEYANTEALQFEVFAPNEVQAIKKAVKKYPLGILNDSPITCVKILETISNNTTRELDQTVSEEATK